MRPIIPALLMHLYAGSVFAHGAGSHSATATWSFDPWIAMPIAISGAFYGIGAARLWRRTENGRHQNLVRLTLFASGWALLAAALMSPLHWLGEHLFTFHMIEHEVVMAVSAPLLARSRPISTFLWALPRTARRAVGSVLNLRPVRGIWEWTSRGFNATVLHGVAIWAWHIPWLFDASVTDDTVHRLQHLSFLLTALLFWWSVLWRCPHGIAAWHLFVTMIHTGVLGALMALAPRVLYVSQTAEAQVWGLTPLEDQQLAGMLMWIPAGTVYAGAALSMLALWIKQSGIGKGSIRSV